MTIGETLYIVIPAYNEAENLSELLDNWYPMLSLAGPDSRILIIDDGSKDDSKEVLTGLSADRPALIVRYEKNKGHGPTLVQAYRLALEAGADYIFQTDSDNQTDAQAFPDLWLRRKEYLCLAGLRKNREDGRNRLFVSRMLSLLLMFFYRKWTPDSNVPYRLFDRRLLKGLIALKADSCKIPNALLFVETEKLGQKIYREPIRFQARKKGTNSISMKKIWHIGWESIHSFSQASHCFFAHRKELQQSLNAVAADKSM